jgi:hypothetical protein
MPRLKSSFSFWALVAFIALLGLQASPYPGIFLMMLGAPLWCGLLANAFLIGLIVEATLGRVPRWLLLVPLAAYGSYGVLYVKQGLDIDARARQLQASNPSLVLQFDPTRHSLVLPQLRANLLAAHYDIPVTYDARPNFKPEGFVSHRLIDRQQCADARAAATRLKTQGLYVVSFGLVTPVRIENGALIPTYIKDVCLLNFPQKPDLPQIVVTRRQDRSVSRRERPIMQQSFDFSLDGKIFASYQTASVWRLPRFPILIIGCGLNDAAPSWDCFADFDRSLQEIDTAPKSIDKSRYDVPESIVLGLRQYAPDHYVDFQGDDRWTALIGHIDDYPKEQAQFEADHKADLFKQFSDFVHDSAVETTATGRIIDLTYQGTRAPPDGMEAAVLAKPDQLVALRDAMAARFVQLAKANALSSNKWVRLLEKSLVALPREAYLDMPDDEVDRLLDALRASSGWDSFQDFYLRMTDAGPRTLGFYQEALAKAGPARASHSKAPELAICRLGQADEPTRAFLRNEFSVSSKSDKFDDAVESNSAAFVTLLKLGDAAVADGVPASYERKDVVGWYDAVRQGKGRTDVGSNNCNGWSRGGFRDMAWLRRFAPPLRPALIYTESEHAWVDAEPR